MTSTRQQGRSIVVELGVDVATGFGLVVDHKRSLVIRSRLMASRASTEPLCRRSQPG